MEPKYDNIGIGYSKRRMSDPEIARQLNSKLQGATRILNIGAGTGSYEPKNIDLVAVEPSAKMIAQRDPGSHPVVQSFAESLPFENNSFSHTMTVLSMHHWSDRKQAYSEINRVTTKKFIAISWNPDSEPFWLTKEYFPEIYETDLTIFPSIEDIKNSFKNVEISPLLIPFDCQDGFLAAYWRRPEAYLDKEVRNSISTFSKLEKLKQGLAKLESDLKQGIWETKNKSILESKWLDAGYIIITADTV